MCAMLILFHIYMFIIMINHDIVVIYEKNFNNFTCIYFVN